MDPTARERQELEQSVADTALAAIVAAWRTRLPRLVEHLNEQFGYVVTHPLQIKRLFICEQADGTVIPEYIGTRFRRKWVVEGGHLRDAPIDFAWKEMYDTDDSGDVYVSPSFLFCSQDDLILLSERYGSGLIHRLRGRVVNDGTRPGVEWSTLWKGGCPRQESTQKSARWWQFWK